MAGVGNELDGTQRVAGISQRKSQTLMNQHEFSSSLVRDDNSIVLDPMNSQRQYINQEPRQETMTFSNKFLEVDREISIIVSDNASNAANLEPYKNSNSISKTRSRPGPINLQGLNSNRRSLDGDIFER